MSLEEIEKLGLKDVSDFFDCENMVLGAFLDAYLADNQPTNPLSPLPKSQNKLASTSVYNNYVIIIKCIQILNLEEMVCFHFSFFILF